MCSIDQPRYVDHHEPIALIFDNAQHRLQCRERIVRYLWPRFCQRREQTRLARVWSADNANIRKQLQLETKKNLFSRVAFLRKKGILVCRGCKTCVAAPTAPATSNQNLLPMLSKVGYAVPRGIVPYLSADRNCKLDVVAVLAMPLLARAIAAIPRTVHASIAKTEQRSEISIASSVNAAACASIPSIGAPVRHELFPAAAYRAVSTFSTCYSDPHLVYHLYKSITVSNSICVDMLENAPDGRCRRRYPLPPGVSILLTVCANLMDRL